MAEDMIDNDTENNDKDAEERKPTKSKDDNNALNESKVDADTNLKNNQEDKNEQSEISADFEKKENNEETPSDSDEPLDVPKKSKRLISIAIAIVLLGALMAVTLFFVISDDTPDENTESLNTIATEDKSEMDNKKEPEIPKSEIKDSSAKFYTIVDPFVVLMSSEDKARHYLRVQISLYYKENKNNEDQVETSMYKDYLEEIEPLIKNDIVDYLSSVPYEVARDFSSKSKLKEETLKVIRKITTKNKEKGKVEKVLFTDFVVE